MKSDRSVQYWTRMSSQDIENMWAEEYPCIIIPIGVCEAHGEFLPVGLDVMFAGVVAHLVAERIQQRGARPIIFDCVNYCGVVGASFGLTGTIGFPALQSTERLFTALQELFAEGFERFFIINGDAGTAKSLIPFLYRATEERQKFFYEHDGAISLFTWFDGIENVGHASIVEHAFYTYLVQLADYHTREVANQLGMVRSLNNELLKKLDVAPRKYPTPRQEFSSWQSLDEQNNKYGISYFSYDEYRKFLDSGKVHELWERQLTRIAEDMLAIMNIRNDSSTIKGVVE